MGIEEDKAKKAAEEKAKKKAEYEKPLTGKQLNAIQTVTQAVRLLCSVLSIIEYKAQDVPKHYRPSAFLLLCQHGSASKMGGRRTNSNFHQRQCVKHGEKLIAGVLDLLHQGATDEVKKKAPVKDFNYYKQHTRLESHHPILGNGERDMQL